MGPGWPPSSPHGRKTSHHGDRTDAPGTPSACGFEWFRHPPHSRAPNARVHEKVSDCRRHEEVPVPAASSAAVAPGQGAWIAPARKGTGAQSLCSARLSQIVQCPGGRLTRVSKPRTPSPAPHGRTQWDAMTEAAGTGPWRAAKLAVLIAVRYWPRSWLAAGAVWVACHALEILVRHH
jgi:hypothetical protein